MTKDYKNSKFKKRLRISEENHEFLATYKAPFKTMAGFADKILNKHKKDFYKRQEKEQNPPTAPV